MTTFPQAQEFQVIIGERIAQPKRRFPVQRLDNLLRQGKSPLEAAQLLGLQEKYVENRWKLLRTEQAGASRDVSTPKFARDQLFVAICLAHGGLPTAHRLHTGTTVYLGPSGGPWRPQIPAQAEIDALYAQFPID